MAIPDHREEPAVESRLSIVGVDPERGFAGGETQVMGLTRELLRMGHRAELICDPSGLLNQRAQSEGIRCHPLVLRNSLDLIGAIRLRKILARGDYDIVHFHTSRAHAMAPYVRGLARALVVTRRMDYRPNRLFAPYLYSRAVDGVAAISHAVADALAAAGVARESIAIVPSGVDAEYFRPPSEVERAAARRDFGIGPKTIAIGTLGALEMRKGHRYLLEAIATLEGSIACWIAGAGSLRSDLESHAARLGIADRIRFLSRISDSRALLWALDIFVFPSLAEGLGVAVLEAAACGLAIVAARAGGIEEVVIDGKTGALVAPADAPELSKAIARLASSPELRTAMGGAGRVRVEESFAMGKMAERTLALYRECLRARKDRA